MDKVCRFRGIWPKIGGTLLLSLACSLGGAQGTAIPAGPPANFDVQTATPTVDPSQITVEPEVSQPEAIVIVPLGDAPTRTPDPNATPSPTASPTASPIRFTPTSSATDTPEPTPTIVVPTPTVFVPTPTRVVELDPPRQGGGWDFEVDYIPWPNPYGEPCPGASVAAGWTAFVEKGQFGSSCLNENLYQPNVFSGQKSQEITFDFIASNAGIFRTIPVQIEHRYSIVAYTKHDRSLNSVEVSLGIDLTGGTRWDAETVEWFPWDNRLDDVWLATEETVTATGESMTIFIKGFHPVAEQGGKTVIDNVSVTDLGL